MEHSCVPALIVRSDIIPSDYIMDVGVEDGNAGAEPHIALPGTDDDLKLLYDVPTPTVVTIVVSGPGGITDDPVGDWTQGVCSRPLYADDDPVNALIVFQYEAHDGLMCPIPNTTHIYDRYEFNKYVKEHPGTSVQDFCDAMHAESVVDLKSEHIPSDWR